MTGDVAERGIGGTGAPYASNGGEIGVLGTITGFGSVLVNGLEVGINRVTKVVIDGEARPLTDLDVGQVTTIVAGGEQDLEAVSIEVVHEVSGPVQSSARGRLTVAGQSVTVTNRTIGSLPRVGAWVAVSGLRDAKGTIVATRLDPRDAGAVTVSGTLTGSDGDMRIGALRVELPAGAATGSRVTVTGSFSGGTLVAQAATPAGADAFPASVGRLLIESYVSGGDGRLNLDGGVSAAAGAGVATPSRPTLAIVDLRREAGGALVATGLRGAPSFGGGAAGAMGARTSGPGPGGGAPGVMQGPPFTAGGPGGGPQGAPGGGGFAGPRSTGQGGALPQAAPSGNEPLTAPPGGPMPSGTFGGGPMGGGPMGGGGFSGPMGPGPMGGGPMGGPARH
jgi:hypothetical protein